MFSERTTHSHTGYGPAVMSRLPWDYEGRDADKHGPQCVCVGDIVLDDVLGQVTAVRIDGPKMMAILKEFREMAGVRGRKAHRPHPGIQSRRMSTRSTAPPSRWTSDNESQEGRQLRDRPDV